MDFFLISQEAQILRCSHIRFEGFIYASRESHDVLRRVHIRMIRTEIFMTKDIVLQSTTTFTAPFTTIYSSVHAYLSYFGSQSFIMAKMSTI